jgi:hypothetical protein
MELFSKIRDFNPVEEAFGNWTNLSSSNVNAFRYDSSKRVLQIRFVGGRVYSYKDVPENIAEGLSTAESPGKYVNANIKHNYSLE